MSTLNPAKPYRGMSMEGPIATWYAKTTRKDIAEFTRLAVEIAKGLPEEARVLEIAPGPGFLSVALAKLGPYKITGLDISASFVRMASDYARNEGVTAHFIHGSASDIPLEDASFDFIVCRAAFKNFSQPLQALSEMHRVLKPGGTALIIDLRKDAPLHDIHSYVDGLHLSALSGWMTKMTFKHVLLKRAYTEQQFRDLVSASAFRACQITRNAVGMEIRLHRQEFAQKVVA
jgi:ubiquinone/menaquinone biosynthesis C-methylase UbiE